MNKREFKELKAMLADGELLVWVSGTGPYKSFQVESFVVEDDTMWAYFNDGKTCLELSEEIQISEFCSLEAVKSKTKTHDLKIMPGFFDAVVSGKKTFEIRKNDRDYKTGDIVRLMEYTQPSGFNSGMYTGREAEFEIGYITNYAQQEDYVVFSIHPLKEQNANQTNS